MQKTIQIPTRLEDSIDAKNSLALDEVPVIEQCIQNTDEKGVLHIEEHALLLILEGSISLSAGEQALTVYKNELTLLKKGTVLKYEKKGDQQKDNIYHEMVVILKDNLIKSFAAAAEKITPKEANGKVRAGVHTMTECLITFTDSLRPYFNHSPEVYAGQLRLKLTEMLYHLGIGNSSLFHELMQLRQPVQTEIREVVAQNLTSPVSLTELAHLSGRSLSSFKRDFLHIYNQSPATWIRNKRLEKAKEMLETTQLSVSDICFSLGFENLSHFSRIFKDYHGQKPSFYREGLK
ncbi:AraC family transcriptional regulator [Chitinophaga sp. Cy-1792]|uniref:helix-turn-helix domain-containing protein n=1 Tax=Chitinophaga sp. Cy-1792 TaxID=2608339 RepID=UPI0014230CA1|nr:AraC family transcriptional regulator [Chitinophaga sp. Cy-1792]